MRNTILLLFSLALLLSSCGSKKKVVTDTPSKPIIQTERPPTKPDIVKEEKKVNPISSVTKDATQQYIDRYADIAVEEMLTYKIPASITLAQGILESRSGKSSLTLKSNNHFGIKCHKGWTGKRVYYDDDKKGECFRKYKEPETSFKDHSKFLSTRSRYASLFKLGKGDYTSWAYGLKKAGYATDRKYPKKLIKIIEKYDLHQYDYNVVISKPKKNSPKAKQIIKKQIIAKPVEVEVINTPKIVDSPGYHTVQQGETLYQIAYKYNLEIPTLRRLNDITGNEVSIGQRLRVKEIENTIVENYTTTTQESVATPIQNTPKKAVVKPIKVETIDTPKVVNTPGYHTVQQGETLYQIAYKYHLEIPTLRRLNDITGNEVNIGQKLRVKEIENTVVENNTTTIPAPIVTPTQNTSEKIEKVVLKPIKVEVIDTSSTTIDSPTTSNEAEYHTVQQGETLYQIAYKYHLEIPTLRRLNNITNNEINIGQRLRVKETEDVFTENNVNYTQEDTTVTYANDQETPKYHIVEKGETLYSISHKYNLDVSILKNLNNLTDNTIRVGQRLLLKTVETTYQSTVTPTQEAANYHIVQEGETFYDIAYKYNLEIPELRRLNAIKKDKIHVGQRLLIKRGIGVTQAQPNQSQTDNTIFDSNSNTHTVAKGDTLYSISKKYGLSITELKLLNNIKNNQIKIGQVLVLE